MTRTRPSTPSLSKQLDILFARKLVICAICGEVIERREDCEWHHLFEVADGGPDTVDNYAPVHTKPCHKKASAKAETQRHHIDRLANSPVEKPPLRSAEERRAPRKPSAFKRRPSNTRQLNEDIEGSQT